MPGQAGRNRGQQLEVQLMRSMPAGVYARKLSTPTPPAQGIGQVIGLLQGMAATLGRDVGWAVGALQRSTFTAKPPYDLMVVVPVAEGEGQLGLLGVDGMPYDLRIPRGITFAIEIKSTAGKSLPHSRVQDHQLEGLLAASSAGILAGLLVEFPDSGDLFWLPIGAYAEYRRTGGRQSIPLDACALLGVRVEVDERRGRVHRYWRLGDLFDRFSAAPRRAARSAA